MYYMKKIGHRGLLPARNRGACEDVVRPSELCEVEARNVFECSTCGHLSVEDPRFLRVRDSTEELRQHGCRKPSFRADGLLR